MRSKTPVFPRIGGSGLFCLSLVATACLAAGCSPGKSDSSVQTSPDNPDGMVSTITAEGVAGLLESNRGRVVVVNIWATWCPPCVAEMPEFVNLHNSYSRQELGLVSLSADDPATIGEKVKPFVTAKGMPFPVQVLSQVDPSVLAAALKAELSGGLPVTLIYDKEGDLVKNWEEPVTLEMLKAVVDPLL